MYFGNLTLGQRVAAFGKVVRVVSGHTHVAMWGTVPRAGTPPLGVEVVGANYDRLAFVTVTLPVSA